MHNFYLAARLADALADYLLAGKTDKHGQPLINHARRVAIKCKHLSHEQYIAALLHDCLEETDLYQDSIGDIFGFKIQEIVAVLTRKNFPEDTYSQYIQNIAHGLHSLDAIPIKLADLEDNLDESRGPIDDSLRDRYKKAHAYLRSALEGRDEND